MSPPLWWRVQTAPPERREPSPYADRLTLAEPFQADRETRARGEDRRTYHTFADTVVETVTETFRVHG